MEGMHRAAPGFHRASILAGLQMLTSGPWRWRAACRSTGGADSEVAARARREAGSVGARVGAAMQTHANKSVDQISVGGEEIEIKSNLGEISSPPCHLLTRGERGGLQTRPPAPPEMKPRPRHPRLFQNA